MELLNKLCSFNCCSGNEKKIANYITEIITPYVDSVYTDALGNVIANKKGKGNKLLFATNMDETGFFTTISDNDSVKIAKIGNIDVKNLNNLLIQFENGDCGIITGENNDNISDYTIEAFSKADYTGMTASFEQNFRLVGDKIVSKALSSRIGCYCLIELIKKVNSENDLYFAFCVKKHIGLKGAKVTAYDIAPDFAIILDCADCKAPSVVAKDKLYISDNDIKDKLINAGFKVTVQKDMLSMAAPIQVTGNGIKTAAVAVNVKYINSPNEVADINDINNTIKFLEEII